MHIPWTDSRIEEFIKDYYDDLLIESWLPDHPEAWEVYQNTIVKPSGRPYTVPEETPLDIWKSFIRWHKSQSRFHDPFVKWIEDNIPVNESEWERE